MIEERTGGPGGARDLPEGGSPGQAEGGEGSNLRQGGDLGCVQAAAADQVVHALERCDLPLPLDRLPDTAAQPLHEAEAEADRSGGRRLAGPPVPLPFGDLPVLPMAAVAGDLDVDRPELDAAALRVLDQRGWVVEAHGPGVEQAEIERGRMVRLEPGAGVGDQREARRVRLREAVERERGDALDD